MSRALVVKLHDELAVAARRLHVLHAARLHCEEGCSGCCLDDLTVFEVEADVIRAEHTELLAHGEPHAIGSCAFLSATGACRIYADRPYVCRTQGLPLRWLEEPEAEDEPTLEYRDICPLNEAGEPLETLPAEACWTLGPTEEQLARLALARPGRTSLRALFGAR